MHFICFHFLNTKPTELPKHLNQRKRIVQHRYPGFLHTQWVWVMRSGTYIKRFLSVYTVMETTNPGSDF